MRILALADLHGRKIKLEGRSVDLVVIAGDITQFGGYHEAKRVLAPITASGLRLLAVPGNCDYPGVATYLSEIGANCEERLMVIDGFGFLGLGGSNPTPCNTPNEFPEAELKQRLNRFLAEKISVLISHAPPYNTTVDLTHSRTHAGSRSVRDFIEEVEPELVICGHIHEAKGEDRIGKTRIINPGPGEGIVVEIG
ncbi:hypothetical protein DRP53_04180 [candidate division WOR-3 bacterium]|uniref:Calcineurin-like phosphoesterase domain-containing protein n=1 Tax=candidate division WOR-3 bacterium TaxID=2052148 RepID=A0A660SIT5_UNCW3|nr:MAG: hypothetical protein DRP53_04180 [candidate division WOR-3 bacterium]